MLLSLLYHRVGSGKYANPLPVFENHFSWIQKNYETVFPGDTLKKKALCLTFDDATYDFYHYIYPLLKKKHLKAVLSVPVGFIPEETHHNSEKRLQKILTLSEKAPPLPSTAYCSWGELKEMHDSGLVHIASHSVNHVPLTAKNVDPEYELTTSKNVIEERLEIDVPTFVYPFGKLSSHVHTLARKHYRYIMRIGNAVNLSWNNATGLIYRINADHLTHPTAPFHPFQQLKYRAKYWINTLRKK